MDILIKKAKIIAPGDKNHGKVRDILITKGVIEKIATSITSTKAKIVESKNLHVSVGWMDIGTHIGEPGLEHRETIASASRAAARGGYTDIVVMPTVDPVVDSMSQVSYIQNKQPSNGTRIHVIGAVSKSAKGEDLTEMIDMAASGAIAFGDGLRSIQDSGMMMRALMYSKAVNMPVINYSIDKSLAHEGQIHEGEVSVSLGMQGVPALAEHTAIQRDIHLTKYAESNLILHCISSKDSIDMIKSAKANEANISATVPYLNLLHTDEDLVNFDANLKVKPPIRSKSDQKALIKGIRKQSIAAIVTNHVPLEQEQKKLEFSYAGFGAIGLETCFAAVHSELTDDLELDHIISALTTGPREILQLHVPHIQSGASACLTLFDPSVEWTYESKTSQSLSANSPYEGKVFTGKVIATVIGNKLNI